MLVKFQPYAKAITAAVVTGLGTLQVAYADQVISTGEWVNVAIATLVALGGVYAVPNVAKAAASWGTIVTPGGSEVTPSATATVQVKTEAAEETIAPVAPATSTLPPVEQTATGAVNT